MEHTLGGYMIGTATTSGPNIQPYNLRVLRVPQLYTSGSTGKPKGVEHTLGGYMVGAAPPSSTCSTTAQATSTGAPPTAAGSPGTPMSPTVRPA